MTWRSAIGSPTTSTGAGRLERDRPVRPDRARGVDRVLEHRDEIDPLGRERTALVEPGEEQQIVDQHLHPRGLDPDPAHDPRQIGGPFVRAALEELRVRGHRAQRGAQLVRRVGDELAQLLLGRRPAGEGVLDVARASC